MTDWSERFEERCELYPSRDCPGCKLICGRVGVPILALDPALFKAVEEKLGIKFPDRGTPVLAKNRNGNIIAGNVGTVWLAMDTVCIDIETIGGTSRIYPELGDEFKTWASS